MWRCSAPSPEAMAVPGGVATGQTLTLGVIKQTGTRGFYKVSVSER